MATNYIGSATASESPSAPPGSAYNTVIVLPQDSDGATWANVYQPLKTLADRAAFQQKSSNAFLPWAAASGTGYSAVSHTGTGTGTVTPSGTVLIAGGVYFAIKMISGGAVGTATVQSSLDGGITWGSTQTTAASMTDATIGVTLAWSGTFDTGDTYQFVSAFTPQAIWKNSNGGARHLIDHNGFATRGRISQINEEWAWAGTGLSAGVQTGTPWTVALGSASVINGQSPSTNFNARSLQLNPSASSGGQTLIYSSPIILGNSANMSFTAEFEFGMSIAGASTNVSWFLGLGSTTNPSTDSTVAMFYKDFGATTFSLVTGGGLKGIQSTTLAPTAGAYPTDRFKLELHGSASPPGNIALFFVNDNYIGYSGALLPGATAMRLMFGCSNDGGSPSGPPVGYLGPVFATWNRFSGVTL